MRLQHFVLTRFNVRYDSFVRRYDWTGADPEYLSRRFDLFERFCLPAMKRQGVDFRWLVFLSEMTPKDFLDRARAYSRECPSLEVVVVPDSTPLDGKAKNLSMLNPVLDRLAPDTTHYITTRIDNDDAFNVNALGWIRSTAEDRIAGKEAGPFFVVLRNGNSYLAAHGFTQDYSWDYNHFPSLVCPRDVHMQVISISHTKIATLGLPIVVCKSEHAWLEVVNGTNLVNSFRPACHARYMGSDELKSEFAIDARMTRMRYLLFYWKSYIPAVLAARLRRIAKKARGGKRRGL